MGNKRKLMNDTDNAASNCCHENKEETDEAERTSFQNEMKERLQVKTRSTDSRLGYNKIARHVNLKNLRLMDIKAYNSTILKELKQHLGNDSLVDKFIKKLIKMPKNINFLNIELHSQRSVIMGSTRVQNLITFLSSNGGYKENQIFRKSVRDEEMNNLSVLLDEYSAHFSHSTRLEILSKFDNHHLAALLKKCLRDFEDALFPRRFLPLYYLLADVDDEEKFCTCFQLINMLIPLPNKKILDN